MTVPWSYFSKEVRPFLPGIPEPVLEQGIKRAAQDFCRRSRCWRVVLDPTTTVAGVDTYDIELPTGTELVRLETAKFNAQDISVTSIRSGRVIRNYVYTDDGRTIHFSQVPSIAAPLVLTLTVTPNDKATGLDDAIAQRHSQAIAIGATALLGNDANKLAEFEKRIAHLRMEQWKGNSPQNPRAEANFF